MVAVIERCSVMYSERKNESEGIMIMLNTFRLDAESEGMHVIALLYSNAMC